MTLTSESANHLCQALLRAESESEVVHVLKELRVWDDLALWRPYGGMESNRSIVGNQQSSPVAALVEKLVNSLDAVLTAECLQGGVNPRESVAPQTMQQAVQVLLDVPEGRIQNLTAGERTELGKRIQLIATGTKKQPNYIVIDDGEGQEPDQFADTFLSLLRQNKTGIPFVQGKFNMGGTGVLQFAGIHSFQLIVSRRRRDLPSTKSHEWGFTIIRRLDPGPGRPLSTYVYLAPENKVPRFTADSLEVKPGPYPEMYREALTAGSVIKLWNYKVPGGLKTNLMLDMRRALEKYLPEPALPIRLFERRSGYRAHSYETTLSGLASVISDSKEDIEPGFDTGAPLSVSGVGKLQIRLAVVKEEAIQGQNPKYPRGGVFFTVNGQLHSELDRGFIERRTKLAYIAGTTLVSVDCTRLPERVREDLFLGSRDRMRECEERDLLYSAIADYLKNHAGLRQLNARRRQQRMAEAISEEETAKIIQEIVRADPTLAELFGRGRKIHIPRGPTETPEPFVGNRFPTYFRIAKQPKGGLVKKCPRNHRCRITYETDAANDYFSRAQELGRLELTGSPNLASLHLWNGRATLTFEIPERCAPGDILNVAVEVMDSSRVDPLTSAFRIEVEPEAPSSPPGAPPQPPGSLFTGLPNIKEVRRAEWGQWDFDERSALALRPGGEGDAEELDIAINLDNLYLQNERGRRRSIDPEILNYWFKYGLCLLALGMIYDQRQRIQKEEKARFEEDVGAGDYEEIERASRGLAVTVIPVIAQLSKDSRLVGG